LLAGLDPERERQPRRTGGKLGRAAREPGDDQHGRERLVVRSGGEGEIDRPAHGLGARVQRQQRGETHEHAGPGIQQRLGAGSNRLRRESGPQHPGQADLIVGGQPPKELPRVISHSPGAHCACRIVRRGTAERIARIG
jgi:hypothetical protein